MAKGTKKENKVKIDPIDKLIESKKKENIILTFGNEDNALTVMVKPSIPFTERLNLIADINGMVFMGDSNTIGTYMPAFREFAERFAVLSHYTDLNIPKDLNTAWSLFIDTNIFEEVLNVVSDNINDILQDSREMIKTKKDYLVRKTDTGALVDKLSGAMDSLGGQFSETDVNTILGFLKKMPKAESSDMIKTIMALQKENTK